MEAFIKSAELARNKYLRDDIDKNELPSKHHKYIEFLFPNQGESFFSDHLPPV